MLAAHERRSSLDAALRLYGVAEGPAPRQAHDARSDVEATVAVLAAQLNIYAARQDGRRCTPDLPE